MLDLPHALLHIFSIGKGAHNGPQNQPTKIPVKNKKKKYKKNLPGYFFFYIFYSFFPNLSNSLLCWTSYHEENMSMKSIPPHTPLLYSKTGVYMSIPIFLIVVPKHRLWVPVYPQSMF